MLRGQISRTKEHNQWQIDGSTISRSALGTLRTLADITALAESIERLGLLQPVVVTPDDKLVAGYRRIKAFRTRGRDTISTVVARTFTEASQLLEAERDENVCPARISRLVKPQLSAQTLPKWTHRRLKRHRRPRVLAVKKAAEARRKPLGQVTPRVNVTNLPGPTGKPPKLSG